MKYSDPWQTVVWPWSDPGVAASSRGASVELDWLLGGSNTLVSADYVGYTVKHLKEKYKCPVVYLTGTVGGLMTSLHVSIKNEKGEIEESGKKEGRLRQV